MSDGQYRDIAMAMFAIATVGLVVLAAIELAEYRVVAQGDRGVESQTSEP